MGQGFSRRRQGQDVVERHQSDDRRPYSPKNFQKLNGMKPKEFFLVTGRLVSSERTPFQGVVEELWLLCRGPSVDPSKRVLWIDLLSLWGETDKAWLAMIGFEIKEQKVWLPKSLTSVLLKRQVDKRTGVISNENYIAEIPLWYAHSVGILPQHINRYTGRDAPSRDKF